MGNGQATHENAAAHQVATCSGTVASNSVLATMFHAQEAREQHFSAQLNATACQIAFHLCMPGTVPLHHDLLFFKP